MTLKQSFLLFLCVSLGIIVGGAGITLLGGQVGVGRLSIAQTTTSKDRMFDVSGTSEVVTSPDTAEISVGVTATESTVKLAQEKVNAITKKVISDLKTLNFDEKEIKTEQYSVYPNYSREETGAIQKIVGYTVSTSMRIRTTNFERMNDAIDMSTKAGVNSIGNVRFIVSDEKQKDVATRGRKEAIEDAKAKAQELATLSGMKLGRILNVSESQMPRGYDGIMLMSAPVESAKTSLQPGSATLNYSITLSYETL